MLARIFYYTAIALALNLFYFAATASSLSTKQRQIIEQEAAKHALDPKLLIAISKVESNHNHKAVGKLGEQGAFQLRPEFHEGVTGGSYRTHVRIAARYLALVRDICTPTYADAWFVCYNSGPYRRLEDPKQTRYYQRVTAEYERLRDSGTSLIARAPYVR